jgi:hypothetical protein
MEPPPWLQSVFNDLRKSWFFRFWLVCWGIVVIFILAALFLFSEARFGVASSSTAELEVLNATSITFPRFSLRVLNGSLTAQCAHDGTPLVQQPCLARSSPLSSCVAVPEGTVAFNDLKLPPSNREINCIVNVSSPDQAVQWSLDTKDMYPFGPDEFAIVSIRPSLNSRLVLVKSLRTTRLGNNQVQWDKTLTYVSPPSSETVFYITTVIGNFQVTSYNQMTWESQNSGWLYCARLGGFMYFTRCLHALLMFLLSLLLVNDSSFLLGHWKVAKPCADQRSPLVVTPHPVYDSTA